MTHTLKIDLNETLREELDGTLAEIEGFVAARRREPPRFPPANVAVDVDQLLARSRSIALVWTDEDVRRVRPDLTDDQAWQVLQCIRRAYDPGDGLVTSILHAHALRLFGPPPTPSPALEAALECITFGPDRGVVFPYQCFLRDGRCILVRRDGSEHVVIRSAPTADDSPHVVPPNQVPAAVYDILERLIAA